MLLLSAAYNNSNDVNYDALTFVVAAISNDIENNAGCWALLLFIHISVVTLPYGSWMLSASLLIVLMVMTASTLKNSEIPNC